MDDPPPPRDKWALTPETFDLLLSWLHPDHELAGVKYEEIREKLIKRFGHLGCDEPEELANRTIDRIAGKLRQVKDTYEGDPEPYCYSCAWYVYKEYLRKPIMQSLATLSFREPVAKDIEEISEKELLDACLKDCLDQMGPESRDMMLEYYRGSRQVKIQARKALAKRMGITLAALRLRTQRARSTLKKCILDCMERKARERH